MLSSSQNRDVTGGSIRTLRPVPDGDEADEGYVIVQRALAETRMVAIGHLILPGRQHLVGIKALGRGLVLSILRYPDELRDFTPYFEGINTKADPEQLD